MTVFYLLLQTGDHLTLQDGGGSLLLQYDDTPDTDGTLCADVSVGPAVRATVTVTKAIRATVTVGVCDV